MLGTGSRRFQTILIRRFCLNNLGYALTQIGDLERAISMLVRARRLNAKGVHQVTLLASEGLLLMRLGLLSRGRQRYQLAVRRFGRLKEPEYAARAALLLAQEEIRLGTDAAPVAWKEAVQLCDEAPTEVVRKLRAKVEKMSHPAGGPIGTSVDPRLERMAATLVLDVPEDE